LGDIDLLGIGIGRQAPILKRADDGKGERIAGTRNRTDGLFGVGKLVIGEFGDRILEGTCKRWQE